MHNTKLSQRLTSLLVTFVILASSLPLVAQQRRAVPPRRTAPAEPAEAPPTFDSLLAADTYKIYCEVRGTGALIRSAAVTDLLDPFMKLGRPPKEFTTMVSWINAHADVLASSRVMIAGWPSRPKLPNVLMAIEFSSAEDAKKFYPELRDFLPTLLPTPTPTPSPTATPSPTPAGSPGQTPAVVSEVKTGPRITVIPAPQPSPTPPYQMKQAGTLVLVSDTTVQLSDLKPRGSKPLQEDQNFVLARNRFASESVFLYVDVTTIEKEEREREQKWEEEMQREAEAARTATPEPSPESTQEEMASPDEEGGEPDEPELVAPDQPTVVTGVDQQTANDPALAGQPQTGTDEVSPFVFSLWGALFGGKSKWPEAVAAAIAFEGDAYIVRTLFINGPEAKPFVIPFMPTFVSGPALAPESPNIFPADTDFFATASLDYPQVYEGMIKAFAEMEEQQKKYERYRHAPVKEEPPRESPFVAYEKKLGLKIKDDILPLLGNELALALPKKLPTPTPSPTPTPTPSSSTADSVNPSTAADSAAKNARAAEPVPVVAISIKDREAVARLIPKIIESLGLKGANLLAQTEKRDDTELVSYANLFAYAFVGNFLVVSPDAAAVRHTVDSYLNHETLGSNSHFRNFTRWQPRQVLGQAYAAPGLIEQFGVTGGTGAVENNMNDFLSRVHPVIDPLTYAIVTDGQGPLHEIHIPKNLLMLMVAGMAGEAGQPSLETNEAMAQNMLRSIANSEAMFQETFGEGRYASLDELIAKNLIGGKEYYEKYGYVIEITASGNRFEATAVPREYGKTGKLSYFIDESKVLRAGDHGGGAATIADQPLE